MCVCVLLYVCRIARLQEDILSFWFAIATKSYNLLGVFLVDFAVDAVEFCCTLTMMAGNAVRATTEVAKFSASLN